MKSKPFIFSLALSNLFFVSCHALDNRTALIIGISQYQSPMIDALNGVPYDIKSAQKISDAMGIPEANITLLQNEQATKSGIIKALQNLGKQTTEGGKTFIYMSGHGTRYFDYSVNGCSEGYITYDGQVITNAEIAKATDQLTQKVDKAIMMLDSCHSQNILIPVEKTRSLGKARIVAKSSILPNSSDYAEKNLACFEPSNYKARSLFSDSTRLGAIKENVVLITAAKPDEVSYDEAGAGGFATQGIRDCLLGGAEDLDASGAVSLAEIQTCAQKFVDSRIGKSDFLSPNHITIVGNRNIIPVVNTPPQPISPVAPPTTLNSNSQARLDTTSNTNSKVNTSPEDLLSQLNKLNNGDDVDLNPVTGSLATLKNILQQRSTDRKVDAKLSKSFLKINQDYLDIQIKSSNAGYVYLVLLGSDKESFYILYPNQLDSDNYIQAGQTIKIPKNSWKVKANGPKGIDYILVMVADSPRDFKNSKLFNQTNGSPFVYTLTDNKGKSNLINLILGKSGASTSEKFGAALLSVEERE